MERGEPGRDWRDWWQGGDDVRYVQFLAKDNVPFHAISFPATMLGSGLPFKLVDIIKGFNWLTFEGGKFSTSSRRGIFTDTALDAAARRQLALVARRQRAGEWPMPTSPSSASSTA